MESPFAIFLLTRPLRDVTPPFRSERYSCGFLLTRPLRDVTVEADVAYEIESDFYSHAPCGT